MEINVTQIDIRMLSMLVFTRICILVHMGYVCSVCECMCLCVYVSMYKCAYVQQITTEDEWDGIGGRKGSVHWA